MNLQDDLDYLAGKEKKLAELERVEETLLKLIQWERGNIKDDIARVKMQIRANEGEV